jgi:hypothetical protein
MKSSVIHRFNAILCGLAGLVSLVIAVGAWRLAVSADIELASDESKLIPYLVAFCLFYSVVCLVYAYCRFFVNTDLSEHIFKISVFNQRWLLYILALAAHGLSLIWVVPVLIGMSDLRLSVSLPLGLIGAANIFTDAAPYLKKLGIWVREAMFTKVPSRKEDRP